jgi:hypothetical protein
MDHLEHRPDIRIDHPGVVLMLMVAFLAVLLTTAAFWVGLR